MEDRYIAKYTVEVGEPSEGLVKQLESIGIQMPRVICYASWKKKTLHLAEYACLNFRFSTKDFDYFKKLVASCCLNKEPSVFVKSLRIYRKLFLPALSPK